MTDTHDATAEDTGIAAPEQVSPKGKKKRKPVKTWIIVLSSIIGGSLMTLGDVIYSNQAVTTKIALWIGDRILIGRDPLWIELAAFLVLILLGLGLCFVRQPRTRIGAFVQGSGVIGVLVSINIGTQAVGGEAAAQTVTIQGSVNVAIRQPRAYGPLGIGTFLTGRSVARTQAVNIADPLALQCTGELSIGKDTYCALSRDQLPALARDMLPETSRQIWIKQIAR